MLFILMPEQKSVSDVPIGWGYPDCFSGKQLWLSGCGVRVEMRSEFSSKEMNCDHVVDQTVERDRRKVIVRTNRDCLRRFPSTHMPQIAQDGA
jgi:hypothetical protein